ncbi:MAG: ABC transporter ATP-binding protein [Reyranella sp.]|nr:MAG: ABC transporter ATP-binding protein [Reyranella sp.]
MLILKNFEVMYSDVILAVKGVNLDVPERSCVALLGANGAGKSTTLKAISGSIATEDGKITGGTVHFGAKLINSLSSEMLLREGLALVAEGRRVLPHMTVEQNLIVGGHILSSGHELRHNLEMVYERFPLVKRLRARQAGYLSGGEQQMLVIGRALMANPKLVMIDEPSLGLAPMMVEEIYANLAQLKASGLTLLIVEQNAGAALSVADHCYVMENGRIVLDGSAKAMTESEDVREFYLGLDSGGEKKSFRNIKHYHRRKRWLG